MEDVDGRAREKETTKEDCTTTTGVEKKEKQYIYTLTAYCPCMKCCGKTDGITASGVKAVQGVTIAADTSVLPFGTKVEIDGKVYTVQDRGGAIKGNRIDIYFDSHEEALKFGRQTKTITILER